MAFDEPLTLGDIFDRLGLDEGIIAEFPSGKHRYLTRHSHLVESDAALPIVKPYKYDWASKTYHVKTSSLEMYLSPFKNETYEIEPLTLPGIFKNLERDEKMIIHFPNGITKTFNCYSWLPKSYDDIFIVKSCDYDCPSKTYHVKVEKKDEVSKAKEDDYHDNKIEIKPRNHFYGIDPIAHTREYYGVNPLSQMKNIREWYGFLYDKYFKIKRIICDGPATIIFWNDGTKTVVKAQEDFDYEKGILYAALKKLATKKEYDDILRAIDKVDEDRKIDPENFFLSGQVLSPSETEEVPKKETPKKKREYKYQKCPVCGKGYNLNYYRTSKLSKQGFVDIRCSKCDTLFRVKGDWRLPNWHTKLKHEVLIKGKGGDK